MLPPALHDLYLLRAPATMTLIALCVASYIAQVVSGAHWWDASSPDLLRLGANYAPAVAAGEWWRMLTSVFLHGGVLHLSLNMLALADLGAAVERRFGSLRTLTIFLLTGVLGALVSAGRHSGSISVGASGAIFGLFGVWLVAVARGDGATQSVLRRHRLALGAYAVVALGSGFLIPGVDNAAHVGGIVGGVVLGWLLIHTRPPGALFWPVTLVFAGVTALAVQSFPAEWALPYVEGRRFDRVYREFAVTDARINATLRQIGQEARSGRLSDGAALARLDREILPALQRQRQRWQGEVFRDAGVDKERAIWLKYVELRLDGIASLRAAMLSGDMRLLARFEARMASAAALVKSAGQPPGNGAAGK